MLASERDSQGFGGCFHGDFSAEPGRHRGSAHMTRHLGLQPAGISLPDDFSIPHAHQLDRTSGELRFALLNLSDAAAVISSRIGVHAGHRNDRHP